MLFGVQDQLGESLDCVWWMGLEECIERRGDGGEEDLDLWREGARW